MTNSPRIGDYALIGNCRSAALVSKFGSIDWCCLPEFHSPSIFSAMLDRERGGYFSIAPERAFTSSQAYIENTNVVETVFTTNEGTVKLIDAFVANTEKDKRRSLFPDHEILRIVRCTSGTLQMQLEYCPTTYYGRKKAALTDNKKLGIKFSWKENNFILLTTLPEGKMQFDKNKVAASFIVEEGESVLFSFSCTCQSPAVLPELKVTGWERMEQTIDFWSNWVKVCTYNGPYKKQVLRSALALKLLG